MPTTISHDGFARTELVRNKWQDYFNKGCTTCGSKKPTGTLYEYGTRADDSGQVYWHKGHFCGKTCHDKYHGL